MNEWSTEHCWNDTGKNLNTWRKICPNATLSTTNTMQMSPGSNLGLCSQTPAANGLNHGMAQHSLKFCNNNVTEIIKLVTEFITFCLHSPS
jgi:hypothetical protein